MRRALSLTVLLLPLAGCYVPPGPDYGYGYPQPGYAPPAYGDPGVAYPGYGYDGAPTMMVDGAVMPLIFFGGGWGYYDNRHEFHRAPDDVQRRWAGQRPQGGGYGGSGARPETFRSGAPQGGAFQGGAPQGGASQGRPEWHQAPQAGGAPVPLRPDYHPTAGPSYSGAPAARGPEPRREEGEHRCPPGQSRC